MKTWDGARARRAIRDCLARINDAWPDGGCSTPESADRFQKFDQLLAKAMHERDLGRVELLCERFEAATMKDIQANAQGELW